MTQPHNKDEVLKYAMAFELGAEIDEIEGDSETAEAHRVTAAMLRAYAEVVEVDRAMLARAVCARNIEATRQQKAGEPVDESKQTRAALTAALSTRGGDA